MAFFQCKYAFSNENMTFYINKRGRQAVAELCQAQVQFKLDSDFLGEDLYMFIQKLLDKNIERLKHKIKMQFREIEHQQIISQTNRLIDVYKM